MSPAEAVWRVCDEIAKRPKCSNITRRLVNLTEANEVARRLVAKDKLIRKSDKKDELRDEIDAFYHRHSSVVLRANYWIIRRFRGEMIFGKT